MFTSLKKFISKQFIFPEVEIRSSDDLSGKVVIVTGASRGIGKAIVEVIVKKGGKAVAISRNYNDLEESFPGKNDSILLVEADITIEKSVQEVINKVIGKFGKVDVLVNNAAINIEKPFGELTYQDFSDSLNTNILAPFLMCQNVIPYMKKAGEGLIVNIGSKISHNTNIAPNKVTYSTTKHAIEGFSLALNRELKLFGIRVSCLMPGTVNTFVSKDAQNYLSPYHIAEMISTMIRLDDIDFEGLIIKSKNQNI